MVTGPPYASGSYPAMGETGDLPWRVGRKVGRTLYDAHDRLIGVMDTPSLALIVVAMVNQLNAPPATETNAPSSVVDAAYLRGLAEARKEES